MIQNCHYPTTPWVRGEFLLAKQKFVPAAEGGAVVVDGASGEAAVLELGEEVREVSKERVPQIRSTNGIEPNPGTKIDPTSPG